jgi:hypothetical protein
LGVRNPEDLTRHQDAAQGAVITLMEALALADTAVAQAQADGARLSAKLAESSKAASVRIAALCGEGIDNPAAHHAELGHLAVQAQEEPRFLGTLVNEVLLGRVPRLTAKAKAARVAMLGAKTQAAAWLAVEAFCTFVRLAGPLSQALGPSNIEWPPVIEERVRGLFTAWREQKEAEIEAARAMRELSALDQERVSAQVG